MPLPVYDAQDAVPEDQRDEYVEHEGKWHPKAVVELDKERKRKATLLAEKKEAERQKAEIEKERDELRKAKEAADGKVPSETLDKWKQEKAEAERKHAEELAARDAKIRKLTVDDQVRALYLKHGGMSDRVEDAMKVYLPMADLDDAGKLYFKDADGDPITDSFEKFFAEQKKARGWYFSGSGASGSGAEGTSSSGGVANETAEQAAKRFNDQRASRPNPLAPKTA